MRPIAVNVALVLVALGWLLAAYGALSVMGDYHPDTARDVIIANQNRAYAAVFAGVIFLAAALWISGYTFHQARKRALLVGLAVALPLVIVLLGLFR